MGDRILLMEGLDSGFDSELKFINESGESLTRKVIADRAAFVNESGAEAKDPKIIFIEGVFQRADAKNANGRIYPRKLWERLLDEKSDTMATLKQMSMGGHLEHPADGVSHLKKTAICVTDPKLLEDGRVWGRARILDTADGKDARALVEGGFLVGISSRGRGSLESGNIVSNDYQLSTFDLVSKPSTHGAYPTKPSDAKNESIIESTRLQTAETTHQEPNMFNYVKFESAVKPLVEQDLSGIAAFQISDLENRVLANLEEAIAAVKADGSISALVNPLIESLNKKRSEIQNMGSAEMANLKECYENIVKERDAAVALCESLTVEFSARIEQLIEDAVKPEEVEVDEDSSDPEELAAALSEALDMAEEFRDKHDVISAKYEAAITIVSSLIAPKKTTAVKESVADLIGKHPALSESKDLLESQESVEKAQEVAESILKTVKPVTKADRPVGLVVESTEIDSSKSGLSESVEKKRAGALPRCLQLLG